MLNLDVEISPHKLRRARGKRTVVDVSKGTGISRQTLYNIESGRTKPAADILVRLCLFYNVQLTDLLRQT